MKLLVDENLSDQLLERLADVLPDMQHVKKLGLVQAGDREIWDYAREHGYTLLTKDKDFSQLSALRGSPPKIVWLRIGNSSTSRVAALLRQHVSSLQTFAANQGTSLLILSTENE